MSDRDSIEAAFQRARDELGVPRGFPSAVTDEAAELARRGPLERPRADLRDLPFLTVDPPGSRDLDQALWIERAGAGYRVLYAIADVGSFVDRGSAVEAEAWRRGLTYYSPDAREPLYPAALSQEAASLLPGCDRPAVTFTLELDGRGALVSTHVERARVRSRAQLTYRDALELADGGGPLGGEPFAPTLALLREVGELRRARERERGGVSLPIREQHVQQQNALKLGYDLVYEEPNPAEDWNAQISLLTGHAAALRMLEAGRGLLRVMSPPDAADVERFRVAARTLGFRWPGGVGYGQFIHGLDPAHPHLDALVWQARRLMRGADYVAFDGASPARREHAALAMPYAHCTAPLRRLADRYVLDLLLEVESGSGPDAAGARTLSELPAVMDEAERRAARLDRRAVDITEAWILRDAVGKRFPAVVLDVRSEWIEAQLPEPPVRTRVPLSDGIPPLAPGSPLELRLRRVEVEAGTVEFEM